MQARELLKPLVLFAFVASFLIGSAPEVGAQGRSAFCAQWHKTCLTTCPGGASAACIAECNNRLSNCGRTGCYFFNVPGPRCEGEATTCSSRHQECLILGKRQLPLAASTVQRNCDAARAACLRTGRFVGPSGTDYGPAQKR